MKNHYIILSGVCETDADYDRLSKVLANYQCVQPMESLDTDDGIWFSLLFVDDLNLSDSTVVTEFQRLQTVLMQYAITIELSNDLMAQLVRNFFVNDKLDKWSLLEMQSTDDDVNTLILHNYSSVAVFFDNATLDLSNISKETLVQIQRLYQRTIVSGMVE